MSIDDRQFVRPDERDHVITTGEQNVKNRIIVILHRRFSSAVNYVLRISNIYIKHCGTNLNYVFAIRTLIKR